MSKLGREMNEGMWRVREGGGRGWGWGGGLAANKH